MINQIRPLAGLLGCVVLAGLSVSVPQVVAQTPEQLTPTPAHQSQTTMPAVNPQLVAANTRFSFKLFSQLVQSGQTDENMMISPTSIAVALSMLYNGAAGSTQQAMAETLELQGLGLADLNQANADLKAVLEAADPQVQLKIANSLWGKADFAFDPDFLQRNQEFYQAAVTSLDFSSPAAPAQINRWVNESTEGKISQIIDRIDPQQVLFLINAVYFKGPWTNPFDPSATTERPFTLPDGTQQSLPAMTQSGSFAYSETEQFQAVSLPYGNQRFQMDLFLPRPESSLAAFYQTLTAENWQTWREQFSRRPGAVQLPKFQFEYENSLNDALAALGMDPAFTAGEADFSGLSNSATLINEVKHKTFIEVNEAGTEAAATTSVGVALTSLNPAEPFQMTIDRPFFCAIRDSQTEAILFMGAVTHPGG